MYVYNGKLNWYEYAVDECFTVVFPAGFALKDPVCAYWQWTQNAAGDIKQNQQQFATIDSVTRTADEYAISFSFGYYSFAGTVAADLQLVTLRMRNPTGETSAPATLQVQLADECRVPSATVYTTKLTYSSYAIDEMATLVMPRGLADGAPVGLFYQWTEDAAGRRKQNACVKGTFRTVVETDEWTQGTFDDGTYLYETAIYPDGARATIYMGNMRGDGVLMKAWRADFRQAHSKKAVLLRFGTGTDRGLFLLRDTLTQNLGFNADDVRMLYFNEEPKGRPAVCSDGQEPPMASRFRPWFESMVGSAKPGEVCFLYVDADRSEGTGGTDEGWIMARDSAGLFKEVVPAAWVAETIRGNLAAGVNLTILSSSGVGIDALGTQRGVLLAGCHETQSSAKAPRAKVGDVDPWAHAIVRVIDNQISHKRGVPTYSTLFDNAKRYKQFQRGDSKGAYMGPSPNELQPIPRHDVSGADPLKLGAVSSHQDPQLVFRSDYLDPDEERFLCPLVAPGERRAEGKGVRFPRDQYPREDQNEEGDQDRSEDWYRIVST
ncbi:uncharacterized protein SCHCODRAFT_02635681 [Schizophyllum commune H4-8]|uniref:Expressed protein n=1 Tax=Schizophyllum commune (strain H4-8 / FGSC 9210) TaxID=578458 RepID=D8QD09_SCHCM|nr:uncharacterized protein SCHCODRAFT_02635681 [Schizophyllum commune H4-8]KAI5889809.1 hypothetical protein SCHCODRAFT_02635681 [Schizophyllum commune H4-8]